MGQEPTQDEVDLAKRINDLEGKAARPVIAGEGAVVAALNFINSLVPKWLITTTIAVFLAFHAWDYYNKAQQVAAQTQAVEAEAAQVSVDAAAQGEIIDSESLRAKTLEAELAKTQAEAAQTRAEADALNKKIGDGSLRLQTVEAELAKTQAEAATAKAEADAQSQLLEGLPVRVQQLQAEVIKAEADARSAEINAQVGEKAERAVKNMGMDNWGAFVNGLVRQLR